jgi:integrase/recombinase XerD
MLNNFALFCFVLYLSHANYTPNFVPMPSIKPAIRKDVVNADHKANIKMRVSHQGKVRYIGTPWYILPKYMKADGTVKTSYPGQAKLTGALLLLEKQYNDIIADTGPDIIHMDINSLVNKLKAQQLHGSGLLAYMKYRIAQLKKENRNSYAASYQVTIDHLESFAHKEEIEFKEVTVGFLSDFESHLKQAHVARINTCRIYLNNIRAVFYHATDNEIIKADISPFRKFKIAQEKTEKRSLDLADLKALLRHRPAVTKQQQRAIDIFFLIFYLLGINLKDLLYLKPENIYKGRICYKRFKTGRDYSVKILPQAREILNRYRGKKYLLCFMDEKEKTSPGRMPEADHDMLSQINKLLKTIVKNKKLKFKVTTYSARHSWATIAAKSGVSRDVISHALGHGVDTMTDIYIDYDLAAVDKANRLVISKLF